MAIVKTDIPMTSALCASTVQALAQQYPFLQAEALTRTAFSRPIPVLSLGEGSRKILYAAAFHANEWITAPLLLKFVEELARAVAAGDRIWGVEAANLLKASTLYFVPMVNPDGVDLVTEAITPGELQYEAAHALADFYPGIPFPKGWKANLLGVDPNLQYPAGWLRAREIKFSQGYTRPGPRDYVGRAPLGQKESIALAELTEEIDPTMVLAFHTQGKVIYWQYENYSVPGARELAQEFARVSGYSLEDTPYESSFAGFKDWFILNYRRPGFTIEVGSGTNPLPLEQFDEIYRDALGILVTAALGLPGGI